MPRSARDAIVEAVLTMLGLQCCRDFVCDHKIGKKRLSGGQMRRVGIGVELVTLPTVLLPDEPTNRMDLNPNPNPNSNPNPNRRYYSSTSRPPRSTR